MGRGERGSRRRGWCGGVAGSWASPSLPAVEVWGRWCGLPGALFLKGRRKPRARPHLQSKLGGQGLRLPECGGSRVGAGLSGCGPLAPSCSRRPPPPAASPLGVFLACSLARSPARSQARSPFFLLPCGCRGAPGRPHLSRLSSLLGSRSTPFLARSPRPDPAPRSRLLSPSGSDVGLRGGRSRAARRSLARWLALAGAAADRCAIGGVSGRAAACSSPLRPGLRAAPRRARTAAFEPPAAARAPATAKSQPPAAASLRPRRGRVRHRVLAGAR